MRKYYFLVFIFFLLSVSPLYANGDNDNNDSEFLEEVSDGLGVVALWGFIGFNALYYYSMILRRLPKNFRAITPDLFKKPVKWKVRLRPYHYLGNPIMIAIAWLHGIWTEESSFLLWAGWGLMIFLSLTGWAMKHQKADELGGKVSRLIHLQHTTSIVMLIVLIIGHEIVD